MKLGLQLGLGTALFGDADPGAATSYLVTDGGDTLCTDTGDGLIYGGESFNILAEEGSTLYNVVTATTDFFNFNE
jgi:hypothetical protein